MPYGQAAQLARFDGVDQEFTRLLGEVTRFTCGRPLEDDATLLVVERLAQ